MPRKTKTELYEQRKRGIDSLIARIQAAIADTHPPGRWTVHEGFMMGIAGITSGPQIHIAQDSLDTDPEYKRILAKAPTPERKIEFDKMREKRLEAVTNLHKALKHNDWCNTSRIEDYRIVITLPKQ